MAKVTTSRKWKNLKDGDKFDRFLARACEVTLTYYLEELAKSDMARKNWNKTLSPAYRKRKLKLIGVGIADLRLSGALHSELLTNAPKRVTIQVRPPSASTYLSGGSVPYAAAHQYGSSSLPARPYIKIAQHQKKLARKMKQWLTTTLNSGAAV